MTLVFWNGTKKSKGITGKRVLRIPVTRIKNKDET
jgi:hypothetical protein